MPSLTAVEAAVVALVVSVSAIAVGFGAFSATKEQLVVSLAPTVVAAIGAIVIAFENAAKGKL